MIDFYRKENCRAFTYSRTGENHILTGKDNQDKVVFETMGDSWYMVIADGVSSATCAREGAQAAVWVVRRLCERVSDDKRLLDNIDAIKVYVVKSWKEQIRSDWDEYATTVNFAIYVDHILLTGQIGDGLIVAEVDDNPLVLTENAGFYSTETYALGTAVKKCTFTIRAVEGEKRIRVYMASDGIGKEINEASRIELIEYLDNMMMNEDAVIEEELDAWVIGLGKKNGDDKSIGFVSWEECLCRI